MIDDQKTLETTTIKNRLILSETLNEKQLQKPPKSMGLHNHGMSITGNVCLQALKLVPDPIFLEVGRTPTLRNRIKFPTTHTYPYNLLTLSFLDQEISLERALGITEFRCPLYSTLT